MENNVENRNANQQFSQGELLSEDSLLHVIFSQRWVVFSAALFFLAVAFIYLLNATPIYTSFSRLYVEQTGPRIINEYDGVMTRENNYLYTQGELIKATPTIAAVADNPQIRQFRTFAGIDNITGYIKQNLDVSIGRKDDIINVSFDSPYPVEAAQIVNEVVNSYIEYSSTRKRSTVLEVLKILQKEKSKRDAELSEKFAQMLDFTRQNGIISFEKEGGHVIFQKLMKLSEALTDTQLAAINARADYEATKSMMHEPAKVKQFASASATGVKVVVNDIETQLYTELKAVEAELRNARYYCTEDHPTIKSLKAKIGVTKEQLNEQSLEFADAYLEVNRLKLESAKQRETELQASYDVQCSEAQDLGIKAAEYSVLQSELKRTERLCEILDNRIKELNVSEDTGSLNISLLEVARPAENPSKPQKAKMLATALFLGFMFGCALALLRDRMDYRLRSADETAAILGVPVLGVVPAMTQDPATLGRSQKLLLTLKQLAEKICCVVYDMWRNKPHTETVDVRQKAMNKDIAQEIQSVIVERGQKVLLKPRSTAAEAYRTIRTAIFFGVPKGQAKTILITSPASGDGKSTLASNLGITMAQAGQKVLIIDADMRKPMQHNIFQVDRKRGLSGVLAGTHTFEQAVQPGPVSGLDILPCGPEIPNPSEILNSEVFKKDLETLSQRYDRIIIDSPPVAPVAPVADSQILAAVADITLLVLRADKSTRRQSQAARDSLQSVGGRLLGAIINNVSHKEAHYGYYFRYGRYGSYGHYDEFYGNKEKKKEQICV